MWTKLVTATSRARCGPHPRVGARGSGPVDSLRDSRDPPRIPSVTTASASLTSELSLDDLVPLALGDLELPHPQVEGHGGRGLPRGGLRRTGAAGAA